MACRDIVVIKEEQPCNGPLFCVAPLQTKAPQSDLRGRRRRGVGEIVPNADWLPRYGWITERRIRKETGLVDKYYIEVLTNRVFRSKREVKEYLLTGSCPKRQKGKVCAMRGQMSVAKAQKCQDSNERPKAISNKRAKADHAFSGQACFMRGQLPFAEAQHYMESEKLSVTAIVPCLPPNP
ncbi:hypothetical protein SUGI_0551660 [Cryptomeria japonica]|nr:hypothetical protein SUGI_0551660 [Cryptomeria japonica]